jgi:pantoate kinase
MNSQGDVMAESRGGKEDMRLKSSFARLCIDGTDYVSPEQFQEALTSKQLKVKPKANNISGLQLADLVAHPSRNEILKEQGFLEKKFGLFAQEVIRILQKKYDQHGGRMFGKKFL